MPSIARPYLAASLLEQDVIWPDVTMRKSMGVKGPQRLRHGTGTRNRTFRTTIMHAR